MLKYIIIGLIILNVCYSNCEISNERKHQYNRTFDTIGDSITWVGSGEKLRCLLDEKQFSYDFVGTYLDNYGYRHDGHGSDRTIDVINRMDKIPKSDAYFVLIGVNDFKFSSRYTYDNIIKIANLLEIKNPVATIYISTLLPTANKLNERNNEVNKLLKTNALCSNCKLIDLGSYFSYQYNWPDLLKDGVHPNEKGYQVITDYLVSQII